MRIAARLSTLLLIACLLLSPAFMPLASAATNDYLVYVGTYTRKESKGIYAYRFDAASGKVTSLGLAAEIDNPSFLAVHPNQRFLYSVSEKNKGSVESFSIDRQTGRLKSLNAVSAKGGGPCHLNVDSTGHTLAVANYETGSVAAFPVHADGSLGEASAFMQHEGSSVNKSRQAGPHAHSVVFSPDNHFLLSCDLGLDKVFVYRLDPQKSTLTANDPPFATVKPGSGPRHLAFHPNGHYVYVISEILMTVTAFDYDAAHGALKELQVISTVPGGPKEGYSTAEIAVHPSGKFLYGSNRGHNTIAVFGIDPNKGTLTLLENVSTQGGVPRNFALDPTGQYLFAANQDTDNIVVFRIDGKTGRLTPTGETIKVPAPVCVQFVASK